MGEEKNQASAPNSSKPILTHDRKASAETFQKDSDYEQQRLLAVQVVAHKQKSLVEKQNLAYIQLKIAYTELYKAILDIDLKQKTILSLHSRINELLEQLDLLYDEVSSIPTLFAHLTSEDLAQTQRVVHTVIKKHKEDMDSNINNSIDKLFTYTKYT